MGYALDLLVCHNFQLNGGGSIYDVLHDVQTCYVCMHEFYN